MLRKFANFVLYRLLRKSYPLDRTNEGVKTIRYPRLRKFRKRGKKLLVATKLVAIWYLLILTGAYLTTNTGAYFNDIEVIENSIHAGWEEEYPPDDGIWGKSSLKEVTQGGTCEKGIYASFTNTGESVNHELTRYEIYWSENGNPKNGTVVYEGTFPIPDKGKVYEIHYQPTKNGHYKFKAYHETGHGNGNGEGKGPWSGTIVVNCQNSVDNVQVIPEGTNVEVQPPAEVDNQAPAEVNEFKWERANNGNKKINLIWTNPPNEDFDHVIVYLNGNPIYEGPGGNKGSEFIFKNRIEAPEFNSEFECSIVIVDTAGNKSDGVSIKGIIPN